MPKLQVGFILIQLDHLDMQIESVLHSIFEESLDFVCFVDIKGKIMWSNEPFCELLGIERREIQSISFASTISIDDSLANKEDLFDNIDQISDKKFICSHENKRKAYIVLEWKRVWNQEQQFFVLISKNNIEINTIKKLEILERKTIEESMNPNLGLAELITIYTTGLEDIFPGLITSVLTVRDNKVWNLTSHSLPDEYLHAINGQEIGEFNGSCGTAAFTRKSVIVEDISTDSRWHKYKEFAIKHKLAACWSQPIFNRQGDVIATFANYYKVQKSPSQLELDIFEKSSSLIELLIENFKKQNELYISKERYDYINRATRDAIYEWDIQNDQLSWGESFEKLFGYASSDYPLSLRRWYNLVHPLDYDLVQLSLQNFLNDPYENRWTEQYRLRKADGIYSYIEENGYVIRDDNNKAKTMYGVLRDITSTKNIELHKKLLTKITEIFTIKESLKDVLNYALDELISMGDFQLAEVWLVKSNNNSILLKSKSFKDKSFEDFYAGEDSRTSFNYDEGLPGKVWKNKKMEIWDDIQNNDDFLRKKSASNVKLQSALGIPLIANDSIIGVLVITSLQSKTEMLNFTKAFSGLETFLGAEIKRKQLEEELSQFFEYSPEGLVIAGPEHHFRKVNPAFANLLGYTQEELTSIPFTEFIHPDDLIVTNSEYSDTLEKDKVTQSFVNRYRTKSGQWRWISWSSSKIFGEDRLFYGFGRDITKEKKLQSLLDAATSIARIGAWEYDLIAGQMTWSDITKQIHEVPLDFEPNIEDSIKFYREDKREEIKKIIEDCKITGEPFDFEMPIITAKGKQLWIRAMAKMEVFNGKTIRMYGSVQDIHEKKTFEKQLRKKSLFLATIAEINSLLLTANGWLEAIYQSINRISEILDSTAIYLFDFNKNLDGTYSLIRRIENNRGDSILNSSFFNGFPLEQIFQKIDNSLDNKVYVINTTDCDDIEIKQTLLYNQILSVCIAPLFDGKLISGFISIIECDNEFLWNSEEIEFIGTLASNFSSAIEKNHTKNSLLDKTKLLEINSEVVEFLLVDDDWKKALPECLEKMGVAIDADRSYFFQNFINPSTHELYTSLDFEWTNGKVSVEIDNPDYKAIRLEDHPVFLKLALKGKEFMYLTSELAGATRDILLEQNIQSILHIPVMVFGNFFGYIGFDDCYREKRWNDEEITFVKTLASNLSSAIERSFRNNQIKEALDEKNSILERITEAFFAVDNNWVVIYWNNVAEKVLNKEKSDILGKNLWEVFSDAKSLPSYANYNHALRTGETIHFEDYYKPVDRWFGVSAYPSPTGLSVYFKDITIKKMADKEIQLANERFEKVTQATTDAIWDWDIVKGTLYWGAGFTELFGYENQTIMPNLNKWTENVHPDDFDPVLKEIMAIIENPNIFKTRQEYRFRKSDNTFAYIIDRGIFIRDKNGIAVRMVGAMTDISFRKEYELSLKSLNEELEKHTRELEISNRELEQFAYVASHDLQEPLRMVTSFLTQLEKKYKDVLDEKAQTYINFAVDGAFRMRQIILDLLDFSRVGEFYEDKEFMDISDIVDEACHFQRRLVEKYSIKIIKNKLPKINNHKTPILQIFQNLISNAIKYSKKDVIPTIEISHKSLGNFWQFSVKDNGIGIEEEYFEKIFIIFQRLHAREEYGGTGMGLSIVKKIVENLGGKIWVESMKDSGTTFHFTIAK